jgi:hypothetical protein
MDTGALLAAAIGAVGGVLATGAGAMLRARATERTAARLVYAELARNSAAAAFYRATGSWPATATSRTAWDNYAETLARARQVVLFESVHRGYAALEALAYIAGDKTFPREAVAQLVKENVADIAIALHLVGRRAHMDDRELAADIARLQLDAGVGALPPVAMTGAPPSVLSQIVDIRLATGQAPDSLLAAALRSQETAAKSAPATVDMTKTMLRVYDAKGTEESRPSRLTLVRTELGPPSDDATVEEVFDGLSRTYGFYRDVLGRDSLDGAGSPVEAIAHYGTDYDNGFWDGQRLVVGDGDGVLFERFSIAIEVTAHELSHVLTQEAGLRFQGQSGALSESIGDVFGVLVKQWSLQQSAATADWLVGAGLLAPSVNGVALRSLREPGSAYKDDRLGVDPQPAHWSGYVRTSQDSGGVHINCGIPNHAFYLLATALGGNAWERAGMIWYHTLTSKALTPTVTFAGFAGVTTAVARRDFGAGSEVASAVGDAWRAVGITPRTTKRATELLDASAVAG